MRADSSSTGLELNYTEADEPVVVHADAARLEQIVWNLVSNAIKFTPQGGKVDVAVSLEGNFGKLAVKDTGQGIERHFITRIFEMFGQAPSRALSGKGGLGIGLALVKQLVERQKGRIEVESPGPGQGSTFTVWLPRFDYGLIAPARGGDTSLESSRWQGMKVLIVDDSADAVDTLSQLLELEGANVSAAHDGAQALARLEKERFDIVFVDIGMPNMDGYELAQSVRALPEGAQIPLVATTGFTRHADVRRALKAGFDAHIGKPLSIAALTETCSGYWDRNANRNRETVGRLSPLTAKRSPRGGRDHPRRAFTIVRWSRRSSEYIDAQQDESRDRQQQVQVHQPARQQLAALLVREVQHGTASCRDQEQDQRNCGQAGHADGNGGVQQQGQSRGCGQSVQHRQPRGRIAAACLACGNHAYAEDRGDCKQDKAGQKHHGFLRGTRPRGAPES